MDVDLWEMNNIEDEVRDGQCVGSIKAVISELVKLCYRFLP